MAKRVTSKKKGGYYDIVKGTKGGSVKKPKK